MSFSIYSRSIRSFGTNDFLYLRSVIDIFCNTFDSSAIADVAVLDFAFRLMKHKLDLVSNSLFELII
jgi:hypothetical protein